MRRQLLTVTIILLTSIFLTSNVSATTINQLVDINGTLYMNTTYDDGSSELNQVVYVDGVAYLNITYDDGSSKLEELQDYISSHESQWSSDTGISINDVITYLQGAVNWLMGKQGTPEEYKEIGSILDSYFANKKEIYSLQQQINDLQIRTRFLENTMKEIAADSYCKGKIDTMIEYNLSWVKCSNNSVYYRVDPKQFGGYNIITAEPITPFITSNETNQSNNTYPNITIVNFTLSELKPGENSTAIVTVHNFGNATGSAKVGLEIPSTWKMEPNSVNITLNPGETRKVEFTIIVPNTEQGKFSITGYATLINGRQSTQVLNVTIKPKVTPLSGITGYITSSESRIFSFLVAIFSRISNLFR